MPLTRNQQAALQAHPQDDTDTASSSSLSSRLRSGGVQGDNLISSSTDNSLHRHGELSLNNIHNDRTNEKTRNSSHVSHASLGHFGHLDSLAFGTSPTNTSGSNAAERMASHAGLTLEQQSALLRDSTDWSTFNSSSSNNNNHHSNNNNSISTDDLYTQNTGGPSSHQNSPYYTLSESQQREEEASSSFMENFGNMNHRDNLFGNQSFNTNSRMDADNRAKASGLGAAFTTPISSSKTFDHTRTFSNGGHIDLSTHKRLTSSQPSVPMSIDMEGLEANQMRMRLSPSPASNRNLIGQENVRNFHRHARSMGQVGAEMSSTPDGLLRLGGPPLTPIDSSSLDRFGVRNRISSQSSSFRSPSPSDHSVSSSAAFVGNISPHTSISTMRHGGDSSVDTSIDSFSNSVTSSMSANPSRSSSTSDELLSIGTSASSSKKSTKGKTRLRNLDRKLICEAARDDPKIRQEDLASRFGIERSTVSKTLKNKEKWLAIEEESEGALIIKHRNGKFPLLEATLAEWAREEVRKGNPILDVAIKHRALEIAKESGLGVDSFKASIGWIEKFRDRHDLPKPSSTTPEVALTNNVTLSSKAGNSNPSFSQQRKGRQTPSSTIELDNLASHEVAAEAAASSTIEMPMASSPEEVEMVGLYSPRQSTLRNAASSSSMSNDGTASLTTHETPKASKRHYDDMDGDHKMGSSIDSGMARMHFMQRGNDENLLLLEDSPEVDPIPFTSINPSSTSNSTTAAATTITTSKRRKGGNGLMASPSFRHEGGGGEEHSNNRIRDHQHWKRTATSGDVPGEQDYSDVLTAQELARQQQQQMQVTAAAAAAANDIRRIEGPASAFQRTNINQQQLSPHTSTPTNTIMRDHAVRLQRTTSSPMERSAFYRNFAHTSPTPSDLPSSMQQQQEGKGGSTALNLVSTGITTGGTPSLMAPAGFNEDRQVTLEEARESLDLVLAFIARQPANLSPSDYFVLGNLQGTLSALAGQNQQNQQNQQQQRR